jgi:hypothetical protein
MVYEKVSTKTLLNVIMKCCYDFVLLLELELKGVFYLSCCRMMFWLRLRVKFECEESAQLKGV